MYRMTGNPRFPKKNAPSDHDYDIVFQLGIDLLSALDRAEQKVSNRFVKETLFHVRGWVSVTMDEIVDYVRPRK